MRLLFELLFFVIIVMAVYKLFLKEDKKNVKKKGK
jgi:hypothetical protein